MVSDLTLDHSFKVKLGRVRIKVPISHLSLVLKVCNVLSTFRKASATNLYVFQGQTKAGQAKVPISRLLLVLEVCNVQRTFKRKASAANYFVVTNITLHDFFKVKLWWLNIKVHI